MRGAIVGLLLFAGIAMADDAGTRKTLDGARAALKDAFPQQPPASRPGETWSLEITPPFPDGVAWVVYGYATKHSMQIADGIRVGSVFAEARPTAGGYAVKSLGAISDLGIQGVWPVTPKDNMPSADEALSAHGWVTAGHQHEMPAVVKKTYCGWRRGNGVIAAKLPDAGKSFLAALVCTK